MRADAILRSKDVVTNFQPLDPTQAQALVPIDQVRHQVAAALFGGSEATMQVGRFQVTRLLGSGGMGVVYAANDPQLGRTVALKLIQPLTGGERARERLLREAQAMAQLQHANVVGVFEVGVHGDQVYVVMEYVDGGTLGDWLRVRPRDWREVVDVLAQAGDGLAAAHAVGLVHRDFKPANILMGGGRARISDFGLARATVTAEELERTAEDSGGMLLASPLTRTGALLGTPAYMAPEQLRGEPASPASDQFAFGVVLYEALFGHRPFAGGSVGALMQAIEAGKMARPARKRALPGPVLAVIRRALALDPTRRYPDMPALLTALRSARRAHWRTPGLAALVSAGLLAGGVGLLSESRPDTAPAASVGACEGEPLAGVWDAERRAAVAGALAGDTRALAALDDYAAQWQERRASSCSADAPHTAGWVETCLVDRRGALDDLARAIVDAPPSLRAGAPAAATLLPPLMQCDPWPPAKVLLGEALPEARALAWRVRLAISGAFMPRVAARPPQLHGDGLPAATVAALRASPRMGLELDFADAVVRMHPGTALASKWSGELVGMIDDAAPVQHDPLPRLMAIGRAAADAGHDDIAARAWVLAAELLEAGPHPDVTRTTVWQGAEQALGRLSSAHPLAPGLTRDLAYLQLVHARHTTPAGSCAGAGLDLEACGAVFSATRHLKMLAGDYTGDRVAASLLARAHEHAGELAAAAAVRGRGAIDLDESTLGYLDFAAAEVVPGPPSLGAAIRCDVEATLCQIDRDLAAAIERDIAVVLGETRLMPASDGRGTKLYGMRQGSGMKLLGFRNGDLVAAIDGALVEPAAFLAGLARVLTRGGALTVERNGVVSARRFELR